MFRFRKKDCDKVNPYTPLITPPALSFKEVLQHIENGDVSQLGDKNDDYQFTADENANGEVDLDEVNPIFFSSLEYGSGDQIPIFLDKVASRLGVNQTPTETPITTTETTQTNPGDGVDQ